MQTQHNQTNVIDLFVDAIDSYTRKQAIQDGFLVDVSETAREAGFKIPVAHTSAVWDNCVAWDDDDSARQTHQDQSGRLWDVLWLAALRARSSSSGCATTQYALYRVPRDGKTCKPQKTWLKMHIGSGDQNEPVMTIMLPGED